MLLPARIEKAHSASLWIVFHSNIYGISDEPFLPGGPKIVAAWTWSQAGRVMPLLPGCIGHCGNFAIHIRFTNRGICRIDTMASEVEGLLSNCRFGRAGIR